MGTRSGKGGKSREMSLTFRDGLPGKASAVQRRKLVGWEVEENFRSAYGSSVTQREEFRACHSGERPGL